jgi:hypothetical protein
MGKFPDDSRLHRYGMAPYFLPECLAEADDVPVRLGFHQILFRGSAAPDPKTIEEVETLAVPNAVLAG